ncbi:flavin reductase family protein [Actinokineospora globicatena]|uniref:flavin reductase family protein n=1 Tax=Actinokineospora globicatena TaxID=103729 RepID=UPI0020A37CCF|nr:flavin reductase family protein [Actinokineospora globicatena]MCP2303560.1 NADH-FMN oxidoreductase RutF, flavin reductase (DIM6/NTAB) family [Actinokineospora globicatena]GLW79303.1 oxidoreductase [Actinokineospora globicatena]GLW86287.1 oxidoreductase [Actinokineospora globicatena]
MTGLLTDAVWTVARRFPTGVSVVTAGSGPTARGTTVSAFCFLSHEPALVSVCLRRGSKVLELLRAGFTVNVLAGNQGSLARRFASRERGTDQFDGIDWTPGAAGVPRLADTVCWLDCLSSQVIRVGDHDLVVARVTGIGADPERRPLLYYAGALHPLQSEEP